ncbi:MAG: hypothetical protein GTO71_10805, partial [Woeseiaceae bacterium]|nr:hypothetical protein [Woeseiaceae bacterium]NIP21564.1 hypothetical protein [Woeseiaceae bacterium]
AKPSDGSRLWLLLPSILIVIALVGGFLPAVRAAHLPVAQALREL